MSEVWVQVIAGLSGLVTTLAVKYLEYVLKRRGGAVDSAPAAPAATPTTPLTAEEQ